MRSATVTPTRSRTAIGWTRRRWRLTTWRPRRPASCPPSATRTWVSRAVWRSWATITTTCRSWCAPWPSRARCPWHPWAPTPRWRACRSASAASSITSTSCSPRSRTRRSTRCAKASSPAACCTWATMATCSRTAATRAAWCAWKAPCSRTTSSIACAPSIASASRRSASRAPMTVMPPRVRSRWRSTSCASTSSRRCAMA